MQFVLVEHLSNDTIFADFILNVFYQQIERTIALWLIEQSLEYNSTIGLITDDVEARKEDITLQDGCE